MNWICTECGGRQAEQGRCTACGNDPTLDAREEKVRELMADIDLRLQQKRETRFRIIGVVVGMVVVFGLWTIPAYWHARGVYYPGLPFLLEQWALMAVIGFGVSKLLEKKYAAKRFPYLTDNQTISD